MAREAPPSWATRAPLNPGPHEFHADVRRDAVEGYLRLVDLYGDDLEWTVVENQRGRPNAVAYGPRQERVTPFYLYLT
jgi:hypothetical protein